MKQLIETDRLILKVIDAGYAEKVLDYYIRNKDFLEPWEPLRTDLFYSMFYHLKNLQRDYELINELQLLRFWIFKKDDPSEKIIGTVSFSNIMRASFQNCILGYKLDHQEINKGYISEALLAAIDVVFQDYHMHRIEANIMPINKPSLKVAEKLGFQYEGISKDYLYIHKAWEDHIRMALLNPYMSKSDPPSISN